MHERVIPREAEDVGDGVFVKRGGYRYNKEVIELPTVSGDRTAMSQDGEATQLDVITNIAGVLKEGCQPRKDLGDLTIRVDEFIVEDRGAKRDENLIPEVDSQKGDSQ